MSALTSANLNNTLVDRVIDAADAAGIGLPPAIKALHSDDDSNAPNRWHVAQGLGTTGVGGRQQALDELTQIASWAAQICDRRSIRLAVSVQRDQQQRSQAANGARGFAKMKQGMGVDDVLRLPTLAQIFQEPVVAQRALRQQINQTGDLHGLLAQLERTPQHYGALLGKRMNGYDMPARRLAKTVLRDQLVAPLAATLQAEALVSPFMPKGSKPRYGINHHLLDFDTAAKQLISTHKAMMASDITREIAHERDMSEGIDRGPYRPQPGPRRAA
ncbi:MAG: hypothetical protein AAF213_08635 [Pseudomonadota bacterium]